MHKQCSTPLRKAEVVITIECTMLRLEFRSKHRQHFCALQAYCNLTIVASLKTVKAGKKQKKQKQKQKQKTSHPFIKSTLWL